MDILDIYVLNMFLKKFKYLSKVFYFQQILIFTKYIEIQFKYQFYNSSFNFLLISDKNIFFLFFEKFVFILNFRKLFIF